MLSTKDPITHNGVLLIAIYIGLLPMVKGLGYNLEFPFHFQDYTITIYLNQFWKDDRLAFSDNNSDSMTLTGDFAEKIWVPDTFFANDKHSFLHDVTEKNKMVRLRGDGYIAYGMR